MVKLGYDLDLLYEEYKLHQSVDSTDPFTPTNNMLVVSNGQVLVRRDAQRRRHHVRDPIDHAGNEHHRHDSLDDRRSVSHPQPRSTGGDCRGLDSFEPSYKPMVEAGLGRQPGRPVQQADVARSSFGVDGTGITVGLLSDSFDQVPYAGGVDGLAHDIATNDLPKTNEDSSR